MENNKRSERIPEKESESERKLVEVKEGGGERGADKRGRG